MEWKIVIYQGWKNLKKGEEGRPVRILFSPQWGLIPDQKQLLKEQMQYDLVTIQATTGNFKDWYLDFTASNIELV